MHDSRKQRYSNWLEKRRNRDARSRFSFQYETFEPRRLLAAIYPAYIDGVFTFGDPNGAAPYPLADTFSLESNPDSSLTIYLDFDGHHSINNLWDHDIVFPAFDRDGDVDTFSMEELIEIQKQFQNVAEDFSPFDVNVTTKDPGEEALMKTSDDDNEYGVRDVNTQCVDGFICAGGVAPDLFIFDADTDTPVFSFNKGVNTGAVTSSHEVGHAVGLSHDGLGFQEYHPGVGSGETSWGPIMGAPFGANLSQWSDGDYADATNQENDWDVITDERNGIQFRPDDYGDTREDAAELGLSAEIFEWGMIGRNTDVDMFTFELHTDAMFNIQINTLGENPNLDIEAILYDASGTEILADNPEDLTTASFDMELSPGTYYLSIDGVGKDGVYTGYGSVGFYYIEGFLIGTLGETGFIDGLTDQWQTITLQQSYADPVVVFGPPTQNGQEPITVRVRNVTENSFEVRIEEWEYDDGIHVPEAAGYMVFNQGTYELQDGTHMVVRKAEVNHQWQSIDLSESAIDEMPMIFAQTMTDRGPEPVTDRMRLVSENGFQIRLQEEQASLGFGHETETVGFVAIEQGAGIFEGLLFEGFLTGQVVTEDPFELTFVNNFSSPPIFLADMQTFEGGDPAAVRLLQYVDTTGAVLFVQEEQSLDDEVNHVPEQLGYFALGLGPIFGTGGGPDDVFDFSFTSYPFQNSGTNTPAAWNALANLESWGDVIIPFDVVGHNHNDQIVSDHHGGCCCPTCLQAVTGFADPEVLVNHIVLDRVDSSAVDTLDRSGSDDVMPTVSVARLSGSLDHALSVADDSSSAVDRVFSQPSEAIDALVEIDFGWEDPV